VCTYKIPREYIKLISYWYNLKVSHISVSVSEFLFIRGLGMQNVHCKALAGLIRSFLETACNPDVRHSLFHEILFKYHVLDDRNLENPGIPPYYSASFFETIKKVHNKSPESIPTMSEAQWYHILLEETVLKESIDDDHRYIPCRVELANPENDWETSWRRMRIKGLGSDVVSFFV